MRIRIFLMLSSLLLTVSVHAGDKEKTSTPINDFRGHHFALSPSPKMVPVNHNEKHLDILFSDVPGVQVYKIPGEHLKIGQIDLTSIHYHYFNNQLFNVVINLPYDKNTKGHFCYKPHQVRYAFEEKYGKQFVFFGGEYAEWVKASVHFDNYSIHYNCQRPNGRYGVDESDPHIYYSIIHSKLYDELLHKLLNKPTISGAADL